MEDVVSFEVAKLLKKVGFNYKVQNYYNHKNIITNDGSNVANYNHKEFSTLSAPTQSLAQKFLQEKYCLNINIKHKPTSQTYGYSITGLYDKDNDYIANKIYHKFETYESALEDALLTCLSKDEKGEFMYIKLEK